MGSIIIYTNGHRSSCHDFSQVSGLCHEPDILSASSVSMGISQFKDAFIRFRTTGPDYSNIPKQNFDWMSSLHGNGREPLFEILEGRYYQDGGLRMGRKLAHKPAETIPAFPSLASRSKHDSMFGVVRCRLPFLYVL